MAEIVHEVEIESLSPEGDGLARLGRQTIAVPFTIPGERVRVRVAKFAGDREKTGGSREQDPPYAALVEVLRPSPRRVPPGCRHFGPCGGCTWQHIEYAEQLRLKTALVDRLVRAEVRDAPPTLPMLPSTPVDNPWGYRHKLHFVVGSADRRPAMGHYMRGSRRVLPVEECPVHDPRGNDLAFRFRDALTTSPTLQGLAIRAGANTPEIMATLVVTDDSDKKLRAATRRAIDAGAAPSSLHLNLHPRRDALVFGRETRRLSGPERMREVVGGTSFLISPTSFFQTNVRAADILVRLVLDACRDVAGATHAPPLQILDLYAGAGLFALPLARAGHHVVAVEENHQAVADGEASLRLNKIPPGRCRFIAKPVEAALKELRYRLPTTDDRLVVLDPPRAGCAAAVVLDVFGRLRPRLAVYISCNPEALARDLRLIAGHGYRIKSLQPVDMFPHTAHVETVVVLTRKLKS